MIGLTTKGTPKTGMLTVGYDAEQTMYCANVVNSKGHTKQLRDTDLLVLRKQVDAEMAGNGAERVVANAFRGFNQALRSNLRAILFQTRMYLKATRKARPGAKKTAHKTARKGVAKKAARRSTEE